ncbi:MAG: hypothetical protein VW124_13330 [Paracoccaceae bacterium]
MQKSACRPSAWSETEEANRGWSFAANRPVSAKLWDWKANDQPMKEHQLAWSGTSTS